jgi:T-complex protein 1 subunit alpha
VLVSDPKELEKIRERELDITKERIEKILAAGANVILTTKGIDDMALKYFVEAGAIALRRVPKDDLRCAPCVVGGAHGIWALHVVVGNLLVRDAHMC